MTHLFVANWKMNKDFAESIDFCTAYKDKLADLSSRPNTQIVICPSFPFLFSVAEILSDTMIDIGAQDCSPHEQGAYTGQVSALALKQAGCSYCIIGHSEQRQYAHTTNNDIVAQALRLDEQHIEPIICIGEDFATHKAGKTEAFLNKQLQPILKALTNTNNPLTIAYEPLWAIGTGVVPDTASLTKIFKWLAQQIPHDNVRLIYGGSVSPENAQKIITIAHVQGFLIGGASLDFKKFEKIVSLPR